MPEESTPKAPEQAAPAPAEQPAAPAAAPKAGSNKKALAIVLSIIGVAIVAAVVVAIIVVKNNDEAKKKEEAEKSLLDLLNGYTNNNDNSNSDYNLSSLFGDDDSDDDDDDWDLSSLFGDNNNNNGGTSASASSCSSAEECINALSIDDDMTVEQYNKAIGFDGVLDDGYQSEYTKTYVWKFSNGDELTAEFSSYGGVEIEVEYNRSAHAGNGDIDGYSSIEDRIKGGVSYDELKAALGGKDGLLSAKSDYSTKRIWIGSDSRRYIEARISNGTNQVTSVFGQK